MKKIISSFIIVILFTVIAPVYALDVSDTLQETAQYVYSTNKNPEFGNTNSDWAVFGIARSGYEVDDEYFNEYYDSAKKYVLECDGLLSDTHNTEYSRAIIVLTSIGRDPGNVDGYNLITPLADYEKTVQQGVNGAAWALIALDCGNYDIPQNSEAKTQATRDMYIKYIMDSVLSDGGFSFSGTGSAEADITATAIQALSPYTDREDVKETVNKALDCLSKIQSDDGGFPSWGEKSAESTAQVIVALTMADIPLDSENFVKNDNSAIDHLMTFYLDGGFKHSYNEIEPNAMATVQSFYALSAAARAENGENKLYDMSDVKKIASEQTDAEAGEIEDIKYFSDMENSPYREAVEKLSGLGIINGRTDTEFVPQGTVTRAEFAAIVVRALGLEAKSNNVFIDVSENDWFYPYIGAAYESGIINGISDTEFNPNGTITREEAAVMTARAASYNGCDTAMNDDAIRNVLAQFTDYMTSSEWARESLAFCYDSGILSDDDIEIMPKNAALRGETAQMIYNMLQL